MELVVSKKQNSDADYTNYSISISVDKTSKSKELFVITCPKDEEKTVIEQIIKIFGGNYYVDVE